ncbi:hypothetical protein SDJN03_01318, partial [Cucurbita argyrosperma subsp. sororia]
MSLKNIGEKAEFAWKRIKSMLHSGRETTENSNSLGEKTSTAAVEKSNEGKENVTPTNGNGKVAAAAAKLFVMSMGKHKFLEAHGLEQWWSDDLQHQLALHDSKQLKSLYTLASAQQPTPGRPSR